METENEKSFLRNLGLPEKELQELITISKHKIIHKGNYFINEG